MDKKFRFTLDLSVKINEQITASPHRDNGKPNRLLREFLKDDRAVLDLYKLWLLGDLRTDQHYAAIEKDIHTRDEKDIIKGVLKNCPTKTEQFFLEILEGENDSQFKYLENIFEQFQLLKFNRANFEELK
jgi:hypothetical protein